MVWMLLGALFLGVQVASAVPQAQSAVSSSVTVSTAVATVSAGTANLPSQVPLPPAQTWCPSQIFCAGSLLQSVNIARLYVDPKTFVDKPTSKSSQTVLQDFASLNSTDPTYNQILNFVDTDFKGEGLELQAVQLPTFNANPAFLNNVTNPLLKGFAGVVHGYWAQLIRSTNSSALCTNGVCESTLIPLNNSFVVPGGRFREQYYWDSFWIVEGLIQSELYSIVNSTLQNFMDEIELFGFIPNGGRIYYLNRSQPPLFIQMLSLYINATNDTAILQRALPLAEAELKWWSDNRTLNVTSSYSNTTYTMAHYSVTNTAPRPESYLTDYLTATSGVNYTLSQRSTLYAELASGAETGWDYSSRFCAVPPNGNVSDTNYLLRSLMVKETVPIDLNSILYKNHLIMAGFYDATGNTSTAAQSHRNTAATIKAAILDLFWDSSKLAFYDYNLTSNARNSIFTAATFYPFWSGIIPTEVLADSNKAFGAFSAINMVLNRYNGTLPTTFLTTGLQWDSPNSWPPQIYIALQALRALPSNITSSPLSTPQSGQSTFNLIPPNQLGINESQLPPQPIIGSGNASATGSGADVSRLNGTVVNGGNATANEGWSQTIQRELSNRFMAVVFCGWHATGGSIPNLLPRLPDNQLNVTLSINNTGNMYEKFSNVDIDSAGRGGEYTVQAGFGWTNGVTLWLASTYGNLLTAPQCPNPIDAAAAGTITTKSSGSVRATPTVGFVVGITAFVISSLLL